MDTENIRLFVLSADTLNISNAGRELGMAPAVASARLAKLEKMLGADLLHRSTRKVALSLEGSEFLPYAREILVQENAALAALGKGSATATGTLRFAAPSTFAQLYIVPLLPVFLEQQPGMSLDLRLSDKPVQLIEGSFDLALRNSVLEDSNFQGRKLADDLRVLCASTDYLEQYGKPENPAELNAHRLIAFKNQSPKKMFGPAGELGDFDPRKAGSRLTLDDGLSHKIATLTGAGISMNSIWSVHHELKEGSLVRVMPDYVIDDQPALWLVYPKSSVVSSKVRVFIDFLLKEIGASPTWFNP